MATIISRPTVAADRWSAARREAVVRWGVRLAAPLAVFCGLRMVGVDPWPALAIFFVPP